MKKRLLVSLWVLLCMALVACGSPSVTDNSVEEPKETAAVEKETEIVTTTEEATINFGNVTVGSDIAFGIKDNNPIEWQVLAVEDGKALIITKDCLLKRSYGGKTVVTWETCSLRTYLNGEFLDNTFNNAEKSKIITTTVINNDNPKYGTAGGNNTEDAIFILSIDEANSYFDSDDSRKATFGGKDYDWWLRSPGYNDSRAACVYYNGSVNKSGGTFIDGNGVRPVCWINIK